MLELNKIYHGDCIKLMKNIPDNSIDLIITSPPYWKGYEYEAYFNSYKQYLEWCGLWLQECKRILKQNGTFYLNVINDSEITIRAYEMLNEAIKLMFKLHETIIWYRYNQQPANTDRQLTNQCEFIFMLRNTSANVKLNKSLLYEKKSNIFKTRNVGNVWEIPFNSFRSSFGKKETKSKWGNSGFPIDIPEACLILSSKENDIVLDPFLGTGTTAIVCKKYRRRFIGIDLDKNACDIAIERLKSNT